MAASIASYLLRGKNALAVKQKFTGEMAMPASLLSSCTVPTLRMSADDREFEDLLQRAADILKSRRAPADHEEATETRESLQIEERDSDD